MHAVQLALVSCLVAQMTFERGRVDRLVRRGEGSIPIDLFAAQMVVHEGEIEHLSRRLGDLQVASLSPGELALLGSFIQARHGLSFTDDSLRGHFERFDWYEADTEDVEHLLDETDLWNLQLVELYRSMLDSVAPGVPGESDLAGLWHAGSAPVANYSGRYALMPEGGFVYLRSGYDGADRLLRLSGSWRLDGGHLVLEADSVVYLRGGTVVETYGSYLSEYVIQGGEEIHLELSPAFTLRLPLSDYDPRWSEDRGWAECVVPYVRIGGTGYWNLAPGGDGIEDYL